MQKIHRKNNKALKVMIKTNFIVKNNRRYKVKG